jgi:hypothetical protein
MLTEWSDRMVSLRTRVRAGRTPWALITGFILAYHGTEGDEMRKSQNLLLDRAATLLVAVGGEPIAGSGFEGEEPDPRFAEDELSQDESPVYTD